MSAREKIAYLKGLLDARPAGDPASIALAKAAVEALEALADENDGLRAQLDEQRASTDELYNICRELDADLSDVESRLGIAVEDETTFDDDYCEVVCPGCGLHFFCHASMVADDGTVSCPDCGETFAVKDEPAENTDESDG